jgi:hypothetical protein
VDVIHAIVIGGIMRKVRPFKAIWNQKDYDIPILVIAYLGIKDGERWWLVENEWGQTGIPESEIKVKEI